MNADTFLVQGGITRSVYDSVLFVRAVGAPHPADMNVQHRFTDDIPFPTQQGSTRGWRIAYSPTLGGYSIDDDVARNLETTVQVLESAGHTVELVELDIDPAEVHRVSFAHFGHIFLEARGLAQYAPEALAPYTRHFIAEARRWASRLSYYETLEASHRVQLALTNLLSDHHLLLSPATGVSSFPADAQFEAEIDVGGGEMGHYWRRHLALPFNIANALPVISVPNGIGHHGIPTSAQLAALPARAGALVEVASAIELRTALGRPAVAARASD